MTIKTTHLEDQTLARAASRIAPGVFALLFGAFLVLGTGFAQPSTIHNAAHDGRHAFLFPCH